MIELNGTLLVTDDEISFEFIKSSGPGGQNVNKVATAVRLRFDIDNAKLLPEDIKTRLKKIAGKRISKEGVLSLTARKHRRQDRNRKETLEKLEALIQQASIKPKPFKKSKVSFASKMRRLESKRRLSVKKQLRKLPIRVDE